MEIDTGTSELLCTLEERVAVVTLNKPKKKNALGDILTPALRKILLTLEADDSVGCVMITGAGAVRWLGTALHSHSCRRAILSVTSWGWGEKRS